MPSYDSITRTMLVKPAAVRLQQQMSADSTSTGLTGWEPGSAEWWRDRLLGAIISRRLQLDIYEAYYDGRHRLAFATSKFREAFGNLFAAFADNWCDLIVDASVERLGIEGFRFGGALADDAAAAIWQDNCMDQESMLAHTDAVKLGTAYVLVAPDPASDSGVAIQCEHGSQAIVELDPAHPRRRVAGLRTWIDTARRTETAVLYTPSDVFWWMRALNVGGTIATGWEAVDGTGPNTLGVVPIIPLRNTSHSLRDRKGRSDIARVIPIQDAINKLCTDMLVASEFAAYPQRVLTGLELPVDPETNKVIDIGLKSGSSRTWVFANPNIKAQQFPESSAAGYIAGIEALIQHVAAQTRTPPHYLLGQSGRFPSGESLKATETGLVAKVRRKMKGFGEDWEEVMRLAFLVQGDASKAETIEAETIWADPEARSEAERVDALLKMRSLGVPLEALWARWPGTSQDEIKRWKAMLKDEVALLGQNAMTAFPGNPTAGSANSGGASDTSVPA